MRKWMKERLQRRKKTPAGPTDQPAAPPLQPAYFDADPNANANTEDAPESGAAEASAPDATEEMPAPAAQSNSDSNSNSGSNSGSNSDDTPVEKRTPQSTTGAAASRTRRRRGGRGRGGRGREQAVAQAFAPAAVKGSIPSLPAESAEDEMPEADDNLSAPAAEAESAEPVAVAPSKLPAAPVSAPRPPKGVVVLAIGLPGSGKSSWFKRHSVVPLSSDMVRSLLFDDVREQRFQDLVFSNLRSKLKARLIAKRPMNYVDATNLTPQERQHWIKLAKDYQYEVHAVFFDVPLDVCLERHQRRDRVVPEDVMRRMAAKLKAPAFDEGFAKITVVRVKKKD